jgi:hypothetical protein
MKNLLKFNTSLISSIPGLKIYRIVRKLKNLLIIRNKDNTKISDYQSDELDIEFKNKPLKNIFEHIYFNNLWRGKTSDLFFSGNGSHDEIYTIPYIQSVNKFLSEFDKPITYIDLGCGDFNGSHLILGD